MLTPPDYLSPDRDRLGVRTPSERGASSPSGSSQLQPSTQTSVLPLRRHAEREVRRHIDGVVGRALVDPAFAARLLAKPALAMQGVACSHAQYLVVCAIRSLDLDDFARQLFAQFWSPAQPCACQHARQPSR